MLKECGQTTAFAKIWRVRYVSLRSQVWVLQGVSVGERLRGGERSEDRELETPWYQGYPCHHSKLSSTV